MPALAPLAAHQLKYKQMHAQIDTQLGERRDYTNMIHTLGVLESMDTYEPMIDDDNRPQPKRDVNAGNGMAAVVGRVRECPLLDIKLTLLSHNLVRGAAGAALLNAELLASRGFISRRTRSSSDAPRRSEQNAVTEQVSS